MHRVLLSTVQHRGFDLSPLVDDLDEFPNLSKFRQLICDSQRGKSTFCQARWCGLAAYCFGFDAPLNKLARQIFSWTVVKESSYDPTRLNEGIQDAFELCASTVGENLEVFGAGLEDLLEELSSLEDSHVHNAGEIVFTFSENPLELRKLLNAEDRKHSRSLEILLKNVDETLVKIGY